MSLTHVWVQTLGDGLVRADQIVGIDAHQSPALSGKPPRWLLVLVVAVPTGSGGRDDWMITAMHRTVAQTDRKPGTAPTELARMLVQLDHGEAGGVVVAERDHPDESGAGGHTPLRFRFVPFDESAPHPEAESR
jgi:hypothetical protein